MLATSVSKRTQKSSSSSAFSSSSVIEGSSTSTAVQRSVTPSLLSAKCFAEHMDPRSNAKPIIFSATPKIPSKQGEIEPGIHSITQSSLVMSNEPGLRQSGLSLTSESYACQLPTPSAPMQFNIEDVGPTTTPMYSRIEGTASAPSTTSMFTSKKYGTFYCNAGEFRTDSVHDGLTFRLNTCEGIDDIDFLFVTINEDNLVQLQLEWNKKKITGVVASYLPDENVYGSIKTSKIPNAVSDAVSDFAFKTTTSRQAKLLWNIYKTRFNFPLSQLNKIDRLIEIGLSELEITKRELEITKRTLEITKKRLEITGIQLGLAKKHRIEVTKIVKQLILENEIPLDPNEDLTRSMLECGLIKLDTHD